MSSERPARRLTRLGWSTCLLSPVQLRRGAGYSQSAIKPELFSSKVPLPSQHVGVVGGGRRGLLRGEGDPPGIGDLAFLQVLHQLCKPALRGGVIF